MTVTKTHYVDNDKFYEAIKEYRVRRLAALEANLPVPKIPEYIGECITKIAIKLSHSPNFRNYSFREDMIADGVLNCMIYFNNFDPEKSSKPFSYFTQCLWYAFVRRLQNERKETYVKYKSMHQQASAREHFDSMYTDDTYEVEIPEDSEYIKDFVTKYETFLSKKRKRSVHQSSESIDLIDMLVGEATNG